MKFGEVCCGMPRARLAIHGIHDGYVAQCVPEPRYDVRARCGYTHRAVGASEAKLRCACEMIAAL